MKRVIIDTDPGIDDAAAIFFALACGRFDVRLLTTVFGNVGLEQATANALTILETAGRADIPVYAGAGRPLVRERRPRRGPGIHGLNGLGDAEIAPPTTAVAGSGAAEQIVRAVLATPGEVTLLALGPLTNVALALRLEPSIAGKLASLVVMGGAVRTSGNASPVASANLINDPEAAAIVYSAGAPVVQVGLDVCRPTIVTHEQLGAIRAADNPPAALLTAITPCIMRAYGERYGETAGAHYNDLVAVMYAADPSLFSVTRLPVQIETTGALTSGQTVADWWGMWGLEPNTDVCLEVDAARLASRFTDVIVRGPAAAPPPA